MSAPEDGWTYVQRRKTTATREIPEDETTFYVTNIPHRATKKEFRSIFSKFGRLSDIYFGSRKGKNGKNFGFIRFVGVENVKAKEAELNGTKCRYATLEINIAKHQRKPPPPSNKPTQNAALPKCARHHQEVQLPESLHDTMARPQSERSPLPGRGAVHGITQSHGELYSIVQVPHQLFDSRARTETGARASCSGSGN